MIDLNINDIRLAVPLSESHTLVVAKVGRGLKWLTLFPYHRGLTARHALRCEIIAGSNIERRTRSMNARQANEMIALLERIAANTEPPAPAKKAPKKAKAKAKKKATK